MTEFGKTLREAREQKNLTVSQIAETTHLLPQIVEDLENEDFHRISAPIYGRGFVKLYCEAVGLEPKPLVDEFMAILNGERVPAIKVRAVELPPEEGDAAKVEGDGEQRTVDPQPAYVQPELGEVEGDRTDLVDSHRSDEDVASPVEPIRSPTPTYASTPQPSTFNLQPDATAAAEPMQQRQYHPDYAKAVPTFGPSLNFGRLAIVAGGAIVVIVLLILGGRALYRASMGVSDDEPKSQVEVEAKPAAPVAKPAAKDKVTPKAPAPAAKPATKRTPKDVPSLYID